MTEPLDLDAIEASYLGYDPDYPVFRLIAAVRERDAEIARLRAVIHGQGLSMAAMSKEIRERDAKIARLEEVSGDAEALGLDAIEKQALANVGGPADTEAMRALICAVRERDAEIARLRTPAPHVGVEEHVVRKLRKAAAEWRAAGNESALSIFNSVAMCHMVDAANEAARDATEAERRRCATIDHIDIDLIRREARAAVIEEIEWLSRLLRWCRPRLKHGSYQDWFDGYLARGPSAAPKDEPPVVAAKPGSEP